MVNRKRCSLVYIRAARWPSGCCGRWRRLSTMEWPAVGPPWSPPPPSPSQLGPGPDIIHSFVHRFPIDSSSFSLPRTWRPRPGTQLSSRYHPNHPTRASTSRASCPLICAQHPHPHTNHRSPARSRQQNPHPIARMRETRRKTTMKTTSRGEKAPEARERDRTA